jgi:hypothetical protein
MLPRGRGYRMVPSDRVGLYVPQTSKSCWISLQYRKAGLPTGAAMPWACRNRSLHQHGSDGIFPSESCGGHSLGNESGPHPPAEEPTLKYGCTVRSGWKLDQMARYYLSAWLSKIIRLKYRQVAVRRQTHLLVLYASSDRTKGHEL